MWSDGRKVRCQQILHYRGSGGLRPIKIVITYYYYDPCKFCARKTRPPAGGT